MADITNNPFIDHSSSVTSRFPSLTERSDSQSPPVHPQYTSWLQGQSSGPSNTNPSQGYAASNPIGCEGVQGYQQQQPTGFEASQFGAQQTGYGQPPTSPTASGFRPSSNFGQQMMSQPGYSTGYAQQQPQQPQYTGYPQAQQTGYGGYGQGGYGQQQPAQQPTPYGGNPTLAAFDPYSALSSPNFQPGSSAPNTSPASSAAPGAGGAGGYRADHPRAFIQAHKAELEQWDAVTWKQALNAFDSLKGAWDTRKREVEARVKVMGGTVGSAGGFFGGAQAGYGGYGYGQQQQWQQQQQAQEFERLNALYKEADSNVDTVAASYFQMNEVFTGYRHSGDLASKRRVRESCNAALTNLPDWPPQSF